MIVRNRGFLENGAPPPEMIQSVMVEFTQGEKRRQGLRMAYENQTDILFRQRTQGLPNNRLAHGFPRYIVTMSAGYMLGQPVTYTVPDEMEQALEPILDAYKRTDVGSVDAELAKDAAVYGVGVELLFADDRAIPKTASLSPERAFVVYDDTVESKPLFGVYYTDKYDVRGKHKGYYLHIYTDTQELTYEISGLSAAIREMPVSIPHYFGAVPMVEYWNGEDERGDFEQVQSLIDAYNLLQSDRVNDKEQFVDSLLVLTGARMEDDEKGRTPAQQLRQDKMLMLPEGSTALFLSQTMKETDVEVLRNAIVSDIHKFTLVPDLTDEHFAGNSSGVAIKYKLLGLEQLTRGKERWFREGLRERLRRFAHFLSVKGNPLLDAEAVEMHFSRGLPENMLEMSQMVANLHGLVPDEALLSQVPFVENVQEAMDKLKEQQEEAVRRQMDAFQVPLPQGDGDE